MVFSKFFSLSLLFICPFTLARVQLDARFDVKNSARFGSRTIETHILLAQGESKEVYASEDVRIMAELLDEKETNATARYTIRAKCEDDSFEKVITPVLVPNYEKTATLYLDSSDGEAFAMTLHANRVQTISQ